MKKVLCPECGLMNLEKFVTFPNCAGCGARLPLTVKDSFFERWKRPLRTPLWATFVGLCCAALAYEGINITQETGRLDEKQLVAYVQLPHVAELKQAVTIQMRLDTTEGDDGAAVPQFTQVKMRVSKVTFENFAFSSVSPPATISQSGQSKYFVFSTVKRDQSIRLVLVPRKLGKGKLSLSIFTSDFAPFHYLGSIKISRPKTAKVANLGRHFQLVQ